MLTNILLERTFDPSRSVADVRERVRKSDWCYVTHRVDWRSSFLATNGRAMICWFAATDLESVRNALRQSGAETPVLWSGTVHEAADPPVPNVMVERSFQEPVPLTQIQSCMRAAQGCFEIHRVKFARRFISLDGKRMLCLYQAPDAESVRIAQREAALPADAVWAFDVLTPP